MTHHLTQELCVAALVCAAAATDVRSRRIPNWLTLLGVCAGLLVHTVAKGVGGLKFSGEGLLLAFGAYFVLYCLRAMGAGDVKLMAAVGALVGPAHWISVFIATALTGGLLAVGLIVRKRRVRLTLWNTAFIVNELLHLRPPYKRRSNLDVKDPSALNMPHGVAVAAGTLAALVAGVV